MTDTQFMRRVEERMRVWGVAVEQTLETQSSFLAFGTRGQQPVVLKVIRQPGDEWHCGAVLDAFAGKGTVRVYEYVEGAVLLERLKPGAALAALALNGRDAEATEIIATVIQQMSQAGAACESFLTAADWGKGFERYLASGDTQIAADLVAQAQQLYAGLCASQRKVRLLHGDLQHYNVLFDARRGWLAIDPKGVAGEMEYEIGASLRNPYERPELFTARPVIEERLKVYERVLKRDSQRILQWGLAQAVLAAIWLVEDGVANGAQRREILLAESIQTLLG